MNKVLLAGVLVLLGTFFYAPLQAQEYFVPYEHAWYDRFERSMMESRGEATYHTAVKPYLISRKPFMHQDSVASSFKEFGGKKLVSTLLNNNWIAVDTGEFSMAINPILEMGIGGESGVDDGIYGFSRGLDAVLNFGDKVSVRTGLAVNQFDFAKYYTEYSTRTGFEGAGRALPGIGLPKRIGDDNYDLLYAYGSISYSPSKYFNLEFGHGRNFIGDGYRSLLLSDFSTFYPYLKMSTKIWKIQYTNLFTEFHNLSPAPPGGFLGRGIDKKLGSFHYLSMAIGKRWQVGIFEGIVWQRANAQGYYRGIDINYLNPVIFYRPVEFSLGSPDNAMMGLNVRYDVPKLGYVYGQALLDDINFGKISEFGDLGHMNNKLAFQLGVKLIDVAGVEGLNWRNEFNVVRPYTYAHRVSEQGYTHASKPLAHPLGANFREFISRLTYRKGRLSVLLMGMLTAYGEDTEDTYYGRGLFLDALEDAPNTITNENELLQGERKDLLYIDARVRYLLNPQNRLSAELRFTHRTLSPSVESFDKTNIISISLITALFNSDRGL